MTCSEWNHKQSRSLYQFLRNTRHRCVYLLWSCSMSGRSLLWRQSHKIKYFAEALVTVREKNNISHVHCCRMTFNHSSLSRQADSSRLFIFLWLRALAQVSHISRIPPLHKGQRLPSHEDGSELNAGEFTPDTCWRWLLGLVSQHKWYL